MRFGFFGRVCLTILVFVFFVFFSFSVTSSFLIGYGWHDQQRVIQVILLFLVCMLSIFNGCDFLSSQNLFLVLGVVVLGLVSACLSNFPEWALREWVVFLGCFLLALCVAKLCCDYRLDGAFFYLLAVVAVVLSAQFIVSYLAAFITGIQMLHVDVLVSGFSNPRSFGQFQVLVMPVLASLVMKNLSASRIFSFVFLMVLSISWCISYSLGGRGVWVALLVSNFLLFSVARKFWRILGVQAVAASMGGVLFWALFILIPSWIGEKAILHDGLRAGLSARDILWMDAWSMALDNPWFGAGPMHFAALHNDIAAHPHQMILQWLAEWGAPATTLVLILICKGMWSGTHYLRSDKSTETDASLWAAILGALVLAQVDGVFVMPYTQTWLAILVGVAIARWSAGPVFIRGWCLSRVMLAFPCALLLAAILIFDVPQLPFVQQHYLEEHVTGWKPRFWQQGWIPMSIRWRF
ncbi:O-antigen ligase family protein [Phytopseudomonas straminea]|uniref:O-antigen ligase n=1 Tax=Pseudomonas straminea TaxID=47882 RepID=A0A1I1RHA7_PSEOC|nr:O-antigen ligase family protein [Pseudomonas straminea]SFD31578.1 O-antigen ligase [Pseudomonas straminea]